jgi:2-haloacid dehalogenase
MAAEPTLPERAPARRPRVVLVDVFETMLRVDALRTRFVDVGRPAEDVQLFFARTLRDGMALTLAGPAPPFLDVARAALRALGPELSPEAVEHVLAGLLVDAGQPALLLAVALGERGGVQVVGPPDLAGHLDQQRVRLPPRRA